MKIAAALFLCALAVPVHAAERRYTVTDFDRIQVDGPFRVNVTTGGASHATAIGDRDALDHISVDVQGRTLRIRTVRTSAGWRNAGPVEVRVTTRQLKGAALAGAGRLDVKGVKGLRFDLLLNGNGRADISGIEADRVAATLVGAGVATLAGRTKVLEANVQGSASLDSATLTAEDVRIDSMSAGNVSAQARRTAQVTSAASGDVVVAGKPACTVKAQGVGTVRCGG